MEIESLLIDYFQKLGLDEVAAKVYLALTKNGPMTILQASRVSGIERIKIYRIIDALEKKGLIENVVDQKKRVIKAAAKDAINFLVKEKASEANLLTMAYPSIASALDAVSQTVPGTKVLFYKGREGIRQMQWNELAATGETLMYTYKVFDEFVGVNYFTRWAEEFVRRNLYGREIRTEAFNLSKSGKVNLTHIHFMNVQVRYLQSAVFPLCHGMTIYNDVLAIYNWNEEEVFGVEICNKQVADLQRYFFDLVWSMAKADKKRDNHQDALKM